MCAPSEFRVRRFRHALSRAPRRPWSPCWIWPSGLRWSGPWSWPCSRRSAMRDRESFDADIPDMTWPGLVVLVLMLLGAAGLGALAVLVYLAHGGGL